MTAAATTKSYIDSIVSTEPFVETLSFLDSSQLTLCQRVSKFWNQVINSADQYVWGMSCRTQGISIPEGLLPERSEKIKEALSSYPPKNHSASGCFNAQILAIIDEFAALPKNHYKNLASVIHGKVSFYTSNHYINMQPKEGPFSPQLRWGSSEIEPFVLTQTYSKESINACKSLHKSKCKNFGWQGTWQDGHPRLNDRFPGNLPLRFFINPNGTFKQAGDKIKLKYKGKLVVLTCTYKRDFRDGTPIRTFPEGFESRIMCSIACRFIQQADVDQAKAAAAISGEWISSD
jgi:hypothetical protein